MSCALYFKTSSCICRQEKNFPTNQTHAGMFEQKDFKSHSQAIGSPDLSERPPAPVSAEGQRQTPQVPRAPKTVEYIGRDLVRICEIPQPCRLRLEPQDTVDTAGFLGTLMATYAFTQFAVAMTVRKPWRQ